jgi:hypothetical protein
LAKSIPNAGISVPGKQVDMANLITSDLSISCSTFANALLFKCPHAQLRRRFGQPMHSHPRSCCVICRRFEVFPSVKVEKGKRSRLKKTTKRNAGNESHPMKRNLLCLALGASLALIPSVSRAAILGGSHDFTTLNGSAGYTTFLWGGATAGTPGSTYVNPCQVCHIPHKVPDAGTTGVGLWNHHASVNSSYVTYDQGNSQTFKALGLTAKLGSSVACLSCHDGSMAVNQAYGKNYPNANGVTGSATVTVAAYYAPTFAIETASATAGDFVSASGAGPYLGRNDLTHMHPIGVSYSAALAVDKSLQPLPAAGTVFAQMLKGPTQTVECASCHDIHGVIGISGTQSHSVIVDLNNGRLCSTCHQQ